MTRRRQLLFAGLAGIAWLAAGGGLRAQGAPRVLVVSSAPEKPGEEFVGALRQALGNGIRVEVAADGQPVIPPGVRLVVVLGSAALEGVAARRPTVPVLAALVPRAVYERVRSTQSLPGTALFLEQSFARQLEVIRAAFPGTRRVGALLGPDSAQSRPWLERAAREAGVALVLEDGDGEHLRDGLREVLARSDVLLVLPDPQVYNASTIQGILLESYRARIPLVGVSQAYTRAGAALSLGASPIQQGAEAAQMVREILDGEITTPRYPLAVEVHVNRQVARSLAIDMPDDARLYAVARSIR